MATNEMDLELRIDRIHTISTDFCTQADLKDIEDDGEEENVDIRVFNLMESLYPDNQIIAQKKKKEPVYKLIKSKNETGNMGKSDVTLFNYFNNRSIDILIENKYDKTKDNPIDEAIGYCNDINSSGEYMCRIAIGFNPYSNCPIITKILSTEGTWEDLIINGEVINGFIGQEILQLVYNNAGITTFNLKVKEEQHFTRTDFRNILGNKNHKVGLYSIYAYMSDLATKDELKISFTIAFISLKVILEKQEMLKKDIIDNSGKKVVWRNSDLPLDLSINSLRTIVDIKEACKSICGDTADEELKTKYGSIFQMNDNLTFNDLIDKIRKTENKDKPNPADSVIHSIKKTIDLIKPQNDYEYDFDLFGEVYEAFADDKTKKTLGTYFTKRHIIKPLVNIFLKPSDMEKIIKHEKTLCDPFCGTGGMLTESFKHIRSYCNEKYPDLNTSEIASNVIYGFDILDVNVSKTKINMILAEDGYSVIDCRNTLTSFGKKEKNIPRNFDYIITNVPYGDGSEDGIVKNIDKTKKVENRTDDATIMKNRINTFEENNNIQKLEYNALIKVVQLLNYGGRGLVIVPDGLLENPSYSKMREWFLVKCKIETIISLPKYAFAPYTKEKTYAIIFQKRRIDDEETLVEKIDDLDEDEKIYAYIIDNDGYANSDKQYETNLKDNNGKPKHNELASYTDAYCKFNISVMEQICKSHKEDVEKHYNEWGEIIPGKKYGYIYIKDILKDFYYKDESEVDANKIYRLNLLPEKYFRSNKLENMTLEELIKQREVIEKELQKVFNGGAEECTLEK